jgi:mannose-1-phosphate guanylyltransferase / mannose-6-phosphate isomerase
MPIETLHAVILAGGSGTRFWPLSRALMPKQLLRIVGDRSMLALTLERTKALVPEARVWVVTTRSQAGEIRRELGSLGLSKVRVLEEPAGKNTAAAIGLAAVHVLAEDPGAILAIFPADHHIEQPQRFVDVIRKGQMVASQGWLVTLGIQPTRPETGYGYIQRGAPLEDGGLKDLPGEVFRVVRFTEKPDREKAEAYVRTGDYSWNSGIFLWRADRFMEEMGRQMTGHHQRLMEISALLEKGPGGSGRIAEIYSSLESISVDYGIMEHGDRVAVIPADVGWSDVGSWETVRELLAKDENGNVLQGDVIALETRNCLVRSQDRLVATLGVEGLVVVETADALLVCSEDRSQDVRRIAERLRDGQRAEARIHRRVEKPWGAYQVLDLGDTYQVKWLDVKPGARLSYQAHEHRAEHWAVVKGTATVTLDDEVIQVHCGEHIYIPMRAKHRLENQGKELLRVVEVQSGDYLGEDDIVRFEDDYGRLSCEEGQRRQARRMAKG